MKRVGYAGSFSRRWWLLVALAIAVPGCLDPRESGDAAESNLRPDPSFKPGVGDRAVLFGSGPDAPGRMVPLLPDVTTFDKYERAVKQPDGAPLSEMEQEGLLSRTPNGTRVAVLSIADRTHVGDRYAVQVRVLDGPLKEKTAWTPATLVTRMIPITPRK